MRVVVVDAAVPLRCLSTNSWDITDTPTLFIPLDLNSTLFWVIKVVVVDGVEQGLPLKRVLVPLMRPLMESSSAYL